MSSATAGMTQLNVRVNAGEKRNAEEALKLANSSITDLVRRVIQKVSRGAKDLEELQKVLQDEAASTPKEEADTVLLEGWSVVDTFCKEQGIGLSGEWVEERSAKEIYDEAMIAHYEEKGLFQ